MNYKDIKISERSVKANLVSVLSILGIFGILILAGCTSIEVFSETPATTTTSNEKNNVALTSTPSQTRTVDVETIPSTPETATSIIPTPSKTSTLTSIPTPTLMPTLQISDPTATPRAVTGAFRVSIIPPDSEWRSETPDNIWWSEDGSMLFFQDEINQTAWAYDILDQTTESIPYSPRTLSEIESDLASLLPQNASLYAISPQNRFLLYTVPLTEPIPLEPPAFEDESLNPQFTAELWVLKEDGTYFLGNVDPCFTIHKPRWSVAEEHAFVNTLFTPDLQRACMYNVWWIDLNSLTVDSLPLQPDTEKSLLAQGVSEDGTYSLIVEAGANGIQYLINNNTGDYQKVDINFSGNALLDIANGLVLVGRVVEYGNDLNSYETHIWYANLETNSSLKLIEILGLVSQWSVSPNQEYIAFVVSSRDSYRETEANIESGIWLVKIP